MNLFTEEHLRKIGRGSIQIDKFVLIRRPSEIKVLSFEVQKYGITLTLENTIEIFASDLGTINENSPVKVYPSQGHSVKLIDYANQTWYSLKDGIFRI